VHPASGQHGSHGVLVALLATDPRSAPRQRIAGVPGDGDDATALVLDTLKCLLQYDKLFHKLTEKFTKNLKEN